MTSDKFQKPKEIPPLKKTKYDSPVTKYVFVKKNPLYLEIKKNRLKLLQMFCKTYNNFIDFSKVEGA